MTKTLTSIILGLLAFVVTACVLGAIVAFPTMWLWNWVMPAIFYLPTITVWQAWGLVFLSGLLIKSGSSEASPKNQ